MNYDLLGFAVFYSIGYFGVGFFIRKYDRLNLILESICLWGFVGSYCLKGLF